MAIRRPSVRWAVVASAIGALYVAWAAYEILSYGDHHGDFPTFYFVPKAAFEDGVSIYDSLEFRARAASAGISRVCPWLYPPHKALLLRPLSWIDYETSRRALYGVNIALALTLPYVLFARLRLHGRHRRLAAFAAAALPFFSPLHGNLYHGNLSLIALVFVLLAWDAGVRGRRAEGLWLAMATLMKLYPAALAA
ncbi:MAG: DUF2029 domain-containing protein, partial [Candidatus Methylomirabilis sp.]|nr:DUF2029 domain-containing protein [Deltaproteobacteria bacterium]